MGIVRAIEEFSVQTERESVKHVPSRVVRVTGAKRGPNLWSGQASSDEPGAGQAALPELQVQAGQPPSSRWERVLPGLVQGAPSAPLVTISPLCLLKGLCHPRSG